MDLLYSRYASPLELLDMVIQSGRFTEFLIEFADINSEKEIWEFYLHKVYDQSFEEFKRRLKVKIQAKPDAKTVQSTVTSSAQLFERFKTGGPHGTV